MYTVDLQDCIDKMDLECLTPEVDISKIKITQSDINRPALQLAGFFDYFITEVIFCQALFSKFFVSYRTWSVLSFSALTGTFGRLLVLFALLPAGTQKSFFCLSAWRSSIIPYTGPDVNTFLQVFSGFFVLAQISFILLYSSGKVFCLL